MNTKLVMTLSALIMGTSGIALSFMPDIILGSMSIDTSSVNLVVLQILGALYFAFAMLNWMTKSNLIGGIYNRPIAIANFAHFLIAGLALVKGLIAYPALPFSMWVAAVIYTVLGFTFGVIVFRHPLPLKQKV